MIEKKWFCKKCGEYYDLNFSNELNLTCLLCGESLSLHYSENLKWDDLNKEFNGILRYIKLLPVSFNNLNKICNEEKPEIMRPVKSIKLANILGVNSVYLLSAISGPSGTFKDLEAAVVIAKCLDWNLKKRLSWHSTGNTARAYREYSIKAGFESDSYFPLSCASKFNGVIKDSNNKIIAYNGPFQSLSKIAKERALLNEAVHLTPLQWKLEGKAVLSYAIAEFLPETNIIVQTIAGGYGVIGMNLGFNRLKDLGLFNGDVAFNLYQIDGADTISKLMPLNRDIFETDLVLPVNAFEPTLQSTNPLSTFNFLRKIKNERKLRVGSVKISDVNDSYAIFEKECLGLGIDISFNDEKSPFISWAGLINDSKKGTLKSTDNIVIVITGSKKRIKGEFIPDLVI